MGAMGAMGACSLVAPSVLEEWQLLDDSGVLWTETEPEFVSGDDPGLAQERVARVSAST